MIKFETKPNYYHECLIGTLIPTKMIMSVTKVIASGEELDLILDHFTVVPESIDETQVIWTGYNAFLIANGWNHLVGMYPKKIENVENIFWQILSGFIGDINVAKNLQGFLTHIERQYSYLWDLLNQFYADDEGFQLEDNELPSRICRHGWDQLLKEDNLQGFLMALHTNWEYIFGNNNTCWYCKEDTFDCAVEHQIIVSWDYGPVIKFYEHFEMDGSAPYPIPVCRKCAMSKMKALAEVVDMEQVSCIAYGRKANLQNTES